MEYECWVGPEYRSGIDGQKIAIVGYSHHAGKENRRDEVNFTKKTLAGFVDCGWVIPFYSRIQGYFGMDRLFWNKVIFFNFLVESVGAADRKFVIANAESNQIAKTRVLAIFKQHKPTKAFVFTQKGWTNFPESDEERNDQGCPALLTNSAKPTWGTYTIGRHKTLACGFRHPLFASGDDLKAQVQKFLKLRAS
jgi:hypothetical protein